MLKVVVYYTLTVFVLVSFLTKKSFGQYQECMIRDTTICQDCLPSYEETAIETIRYLSPSDCKKYYTLSSEEKKKVLLSKYDDKVFILHDCGGETLSSHSMYTIGLDGLTFEQNLLGHRYTLDRKFLESVDRLKLYDECGKQFINFDWVEINFFYIGNYIGKEVYSKNQSQNKSLIPELHYIATEISIEFSVEQKKVKFNNFYLGRPLINHPTVKFD